MKRLIMLAAILLLVGCAPIQNVIQENPSANNIVVNSSTIIQENLTEKNVTPAKVLKPVQIKQYNGTKLDQMSDVRNLAFYTPHIDINQYRLEITGLVDNPKSYTYSEVLSHQAYEKVVELDCVEGWNAKVLWTGVLLKDLFIEAEPKPNANTVKFYAVDNYTTSLPLDYILNNSIILAYKINNVTMDADRGFPFTLVAQNKLGYKWIKWVYKIELSNDSNYLGTWESEGYSNSADVNS